MYWPLVSIVSLQAPIVVDLVGINSLPPAFGLLHAVQAPLVLVMPPAYGALRAAAGWPTVWALVGAQILVAISCVGLMQGPDKGGGPFTVGKVLGACCCGRRGASAANEPL